MFAWLRREKIRNDVFKGKIMMYRIFGTHTVSPKLGEYR